ncbi:MAG: GIY-YIG nuclease family protein [Chloroflexota bacterium]
MRLAEPATINIGTRQLIHFRRGYYAYVGSAMGGLEARVRRHFRKDKKRHWHIDYLLERAYLTGAILCETGQRSECAIAHALQAQLGSVPGFGVSDCHCPSHLFFSGNGNKLQSTILTAVTSLGICPEYRDIVA